MSESGENRPYDLEERSYLFARDVRKLVKLLERSLGNVEDARQVIRSSGSVAANYIEANEALSKKDFTLRIKICRKEAKEAASGYACSTPKPAPMPINSACACSRKRRN